MEKFFLLQISQLYFGVKSLYLFLTKKKAFNIEKGYVLKMLI